MAGLDLEHRLPGGSVDSHAWAESGAVGAGRTATTAGEVIAGSAVAGEIVLDDPPSNDGEKEIEFSGPPTAFEASIAARRVQTLLLVLQSGSTLDASGSSPVLSTMKVCAEAAAGIAKATAATRAARITVSRGKSYSLTLNFFWAGVGSGTPAGETART